MRKILFILLILPFLSYGQTTTLSFTTMPQTQPDFGYSPGRGGNDWYNARFINLPSAASGDASADTYWRFTWEDVQNQATGVFSFTYFDQKVQFAIDGGKKFNFGIFAFNNTAGPVVGGFTLNYPAVVHAAMQAEPTFKDVADPGCNSGGDLGNNCWVPNWNAPSYRTAYNHLIDTIIFHLKHTTYRGKLMYDVVDQVDIRSFGNVGEWTGYNNADKPAAYPLNGVATAATQIQMIDDMVSRFPDKQLVICIGAVLGTTVADAPQDGDQVGYHVFTTSNSIGRLGLRRDCMGQTDNFIHQFFENNTTVYNGIKFDSAIMNIYKVAPWVGEPCNCCMVANDPLNQNMSYWDLPHQIQFYHMANFGNGNMFFQQGGSAKELDSVRKAFLFTGYRFVLTSGSMTTQLNSGGAFNITLNWQNVGVTPTYENWNVNYELRNAGGTVVWSGTSGKVLKLFLPGSPTAQIDNLTLGTVATGTYSMYMKIVDPTGVRTTPMPIAITGVGTDGAYLLRSGIQVVAGGNQPPVANITFTSGSNNITLPTSTVTVSGVTSTDADGTIVSYAWSKVSGPAGGTIASPTSVSTVISALAAGSYIFRLTVTDNSGATATRDQNINVNGIAAPPDANITFTSGSQHITLPTSTVTVSGVTSTAPAGSIVSYAWAFVSGPATPTFGSASSVSTTVSALVQGMYVISLTVTDNVGGTNVQNQNIQVDAANQPPVAVIGFTAGSASITLPTSTVTFNSTGSTDPDGSISSYQWSLISGPNGSSFGSATSSSTTVTGLIQGLYNFQLQVTDNGGLSGSVTQQVLVNPLPGGTNIHIFTTQIPSTNTITGAAVELGMKFQATVSGAIYGIRFYKTTGNSGTHIAQLYSRTGTLLASATFTGESATGWQTVSFAAPVTIAANTTYIAAYFSPNGTYTGTNLGFSSAVNNGPLNALADGTDGLNGVYIYTATPAFPNLSFQKTNYWIDVNFSPFTACAVPDCIPRIPYTKAQ